jgi:hypothetical protein
MQSICRLRISDFLDPEKCLASINSFLDVNDQCTIQRLTHLKKQLIRPKRTAEYRLAEKQFCDYLYTSCGYAAKDGTKDNTQYGGGNQPLTAESAVKIANALIEAHLEKGVQLRLLQVLILKY